MTDIVERLRKRMIKREWDDEPLVKVFGDAADEIERLEEALLRIEQWCKAYPVGVFIPLSDDEVIRAGEILAANNISFGGLHAQWARHILGGIAEIIAIARQE